jgi:hypothetical protein
MKKSNFHSAGKNISGIFLHDASTFSTERGFSQFLNGLSSLHFLRGIKTHNSNSLCMVLPACPDQ